MDSVSPRHAYGKKLSASRLRLLASGERLCGKCGNIKASSAFYQQANGDIHHWCKACVKENGVLHRNVEDNLDKQLWHNYGITRADYDHLLEEQGGVCASCKRPETHTFKGKVKSLSVDHSHALDAVRGLLCGDCNHALGQLKEDPERVEALLHYIEERCL